MRPVLAPASKPEGQSPTAPPGKRLGQLAQRGAARPESRTLAKLKRDDHRDAFAPVKGKVQTLLAEETNRDRTLTSPEAIRRRIEQLLDTVLLSENVQATRADRAKLLEVIAADALGFGPIQTLLDDDSITEIMVNGPDTVYVEREGKLSPTDVHFDDNDHVMRVIDRIVSPLGRRIDESSPYVDARLPDGSRVNAIIPPVSLVGPVLTVRKFSVTPLTVEDLVRFGSMTAGMAEFLRACVLARLNMVVSGGTGSGKTTLLNVLSSFIPETERIVTIEDAAELQLKQDHLVVLEARPPNIEGKGQVTIRDLVANALRMRPDRIVVGEVRRGEALDMLSAMNTGHDGSLTTAHANSPRDVLSRLETMVLMAGMDLPLKAVRDQISKAIDVVVHVSRLGDGTRRVTNISEIQGMEGEVITMQDIFEFHQTAFQEGRVIGELRPTGIRPKFVDKFGTMGIKLPPDIFGTHYISVA
ncbi:MAG TPA: CpaF family protein [Chloroflexota bacterium]|nr:CpaF family protein [Chloroflexota bacterium]